MDPFTILVAWLVKVGFAKATAALIAKGIIAGAIAGIAYGAWKALDYVVDKTKDKYPWVKKVYVVVKKIDDVLDITGFVKGQLTQWLLGSSTTASYDDAPYKVKQDLRTTNELTYQITV